MSRPRPINVARRAALKSARPAASVREGRTDWFRIENSASSAEVYIYDEIGYYGVTAGDFIDAFRAVGALPVNLHINSPGGDVWDGVAIYEAIRNHPAQVTTYIDGIAASAASFIAMAGDRVVMAKPASVMIHDALCLVIGNPADLRAEADVLDKVSDSIAGIYADRSGTDEAGWRASMSAESWFNSAEALAAGLVDEIAAPPAKAAAVPANTWDLSIFNYAGRDHAPAPKPPAPVPAPTPPAPLWDVAAIRNSLKEAVK